MATYYAIKYTSRTNETNRVVDSWELCKALTNGYDAIFKGFDSLDDCNDYFKSIKDEDIPHIIERRAHNSKFKDYTIRIKREDVKKVERYAQVHRIDPREMLERCIYKQLVNKI